MATREEIRASLLRQLRERFGDDEAVELMPPWEQVATKADIAELRSEMRDLRSEMRELRGELLEKIGGLDGKIGQLDGKIGELDGRIGELDGRIGELDGRIRAQTWKMFSASFVSSFTTAGLVFATLRFA